jgi:hypothetical protein
VDFDPQLTISKRGAIKLGSTNLSHQDLDHLQHTIWTTVNELQWDHPSISIWLVGETIHLWFNQTTYSFNWSDTDAIREIIHEYREPDNAS